MAAPHAVHDPRHPAADRPVPRGVAPLWARVPTFAALRHRNFRLYWSGALVSLIGSWMQIAARAWLVYQLTRSPVALGSLLAVEGLPGALVMPFAGVIADRADKRRMLVATQTAFMVLAFVLAALTLSGRIEVWHLFALALLSGTVAAVDNPARQAIVPHLVDMRDLLNAIALNSAVFNGARIVGPVLAGGIIEAFGPIRGAGVAFLVNAVSFLGVIVPLLRIDVDARPRAPAAGGRVLADLREGVVYVVRQPLLPPLFLLLLAVGVFGFSYATLLPAFASDVLRGSAGAYGLLMLANGIGATLGALGVASLRPRRPGRLILGSGAAFVVALLALAAARSVPLALAAMLGVGAGLMTFMAAANTTVQRVVPDALRGRVMSLYMLSFFGVGPVGSVLAGLLAAWLGTPAAIAIGALVCGAVVLLVRLWSPAFVRLRPMAPAPATE